MNNVRKLANKIKKGLNQIENTIFREDPSCEIINGKTIRMSPKPSLNHTRISRNIDRLFGRYLDGKRCEAFPDGVELHLDDNNVVIPDAMIVCNKDIIKGRGIYGAPDLIVEVLFPSTAKRDRGYKKQLYEKHGIKEYWIVDVLGKSIEVHLLKNRKFELDNVYTLYPEEEWEEMTEEERNEAILSFHVSLYPDFIIDIREIFRDID